MTNHRYPAHILDVIKTTTIMKMVDGEFGAIPQKGVKSTPRSGDGGFYARAQRSIQSEYGHRIGQGHLHKLKNEALSILKHTGPAPSTKPVIPISEQVKIKRLNLKAIRENMSNREIATMSSIRAYSEHAPITVKQREIVNSMYQSIYIERCSK